MTLIRNTIWIIIGLTLIPVILFGVFLDWVLFGTEEDRIKESYNKL